MRTRKEAALAVAAVLAAGVVAVQTGALPAVALLVGAMLAIVLQAIWSLRC